MWNYTCVTFLKRKYRVDSSLHRDKKSKERVVTSAIKCLFVPHGNIDDEKDQIRKDAVRAQFPVIRFLLCRAALHKRYLVSVEIKSAFLRVLGFFREVYVKPTRRWTSSSEIYLKLLKPAYGLVDAPRLWQLTKYSWLFFIGFTTIPCLHQLFHHNNEFP